MTTHRALAAILFVLLIGFDAHASSSVAQGTAPSCTLTANPSSVSAGGKFTLSWTTLGSPLVGYLTVNREGYITDNSVGGTVWEALTGAVFPQGSRTIGVGAAGTYAYTLTIGPSTPLSSCATTVRVSGMASPPPLPSIIDRIGLAGIFFRPSSAQAYGSMPLDVSWSSTDPVRATITGYYNNSFNEEPYHLSHGRFGAPLDHDKAWYEAHHPDWLVYKQDETLAVWPGRRVSTLMPLDFTNPAVQDYIWDRRTAGIIANRYRAVSYDNVAALNFEKRWGIKKNGAWIKQYTGIFGGQNPVDPAKGDPAYAYAVQAWLRATVARVHASGLLLFANIPYAFGGEQWMKTMADTLSSNDVLLNEQAFNSHDGTCVTPDRYVLDQYWLARYRTFSHIARHHGLILAHGCFGSTPRIKDVSISYMSWIVSNYLLLREPHTYLGFMSSDEAHDNYDRPELRVRIGAPLRPAKQSGVLWTREYENGIAVVNPSSTQRAVLTLGSDRYHDLAGVRRQGSIDVPPASGFVLVRDRS